MRYIVYALSIIFALLTILLIYSFILTGDEATTGANISATVEQKPAATSVTPADATQTKSSLETKSQLPVSDLEINPTLNEALPVNQDSQPLSPLFWIALITSLSTILLSAITVYLYLWRVRISSDLNIFVPEEQIKRSDIQIEQLKELRRLLPEMAKLIDDRSSKTIRKTGDIEETLLRFQTALDSKDKEISRLKEGYDLKLYKSFIGSFFRLYKSLERAKDETQLSQADVENLLVLMENAFENAGVEFFIPPEGLNYRDNNHLFKSQPREVETNDSSKDFLVEKIIAPGLRSIQDEEVVIIPAEVTVYKYNGG